jgi:hypothetical protein
VGVQSNFSYLGTCQNATASMLVVPVSDAAIVTQPSVLPFTLPIHPEMIQ